MFWTWSGRQCAELVWSKSRGAVHPVRLAQHRLGFPLQLPTRQPPWALPSDRQGHQVTLSIPSQGTHYTLTSYNTQNSVSASLSSSRRDTALGAPSWPPGAPGNPLHPQPAPTLYLTLPTPDQSTHHTLTPALTSACTPQRPSPVLNQTVCPGSLMTAKAPDDRPYPSLARVPTSLTVLQVSVTSLSTLSNKTLKIKLIISFWKEVMGLCWFVS